MPSVRVNALICGALFVAAGILSVRWKRKMHFEPVWVTLGLLLFLGALVSGVFSGADWLLWEIPLAICSGTVIAVSYRLRRVLDFSMGVIAAYLGLLRFLGDAGGESSLTVIACSSLGVVALLVSVQRRMRDRQ